MFLSARIKAGITNPTQMTEDVQYVIWTHSFLGSQNLLLQYAKYSCMVPKPPSELILFYGSEI